MERAVVKPSHMSSVISVRALSAGVVWRSLAPSVCHCAADAVKTTALVYGHVCRPHGNEGALWMHYPLAGTSNQWETMN